MTTTEDSTDKFDTSESNLSTVQEILSEIGYHVAPFRVDSSNCAVPAMRRRLYMLAVNAADSRHDLNTDDDVDKMWNDVTKCLKAFKIAPPALLDTLIADDDELLAAMLKYEKDQKDSEREPVQTKPMKWISDHIKLCASARPALRYGKIKGDPATIASEWHLVLTEREASLLRCVQAMYGKDISLDVTQDVGQLRTALPGAVLKTLVPNNCWWIGAKRHVLTGPECLGLQAFPWQRHKQVVSEHVAKKGDGLFRDLAGNAFTGTAVASLLLALFISVPRKSKHEPAGRDHVVVDDAMTSALASASSSLFA